MDFISYEQFGVNFVELAVTAKRVLAAVTDIAGDKFQVGPIAAGPGGVAVVKADGTIGTAKVETIPRPMLRFEAKLPIDLNLEVRLAGVPQRYTGILEVPLSISVRTAEPLTLLIEVAPVVPGDVVVDLNAGGPSAGMLQRIGNIDQEVRNQVARVVNDRIDTEQSRESRRIDVGALIDKAMDR